MHCNRRVTLVPFTPKQVQEDQARLYEEYECELREKEKGEAESGEQRKALVTSANEVY